MSVGRNDPCPCGSGRKYKKCCLPVDEAARPVIREEARSTLHDLDQRFVGRVLDWAAERFGDDVGWAHPEVAKGGIELLLPWAAYHYAIEGVPLFEWYARENASTLSRREREWIDAQRRSWMSVWEVRESAPGKSMVLADLLTGERRLVQEAAASRIVVARDAILARVVDLGNDSVLVGAHHQPLRPRDAADAVERVLRELRSPLPISIEGLRGQDATLALITVWNSVIDEVDDRLARAPKLRNTDGDVLRFIADGYRFDASARDAVEAALSSITGATEPRDEDDGTRVVTFQRKRDNTMVGAAFLSADGELRVETNSRRRATALRKKVEKACGGLLKGHRRSEENPVDALLAARDDDAFDEVEEGGETFPEYDAIVLEQKRRHYAAWPDQELPALGNKTPREAARSRRGREALTVLLKELENGEAHQSAASRFDVNVLRRELGIEE